MPGTGPGIRRKGFGSRRAAHQKRDMDYLSDLIRNRLTAASNGTSLLP
jgi:hypothetical protein